MSEDDNKKVTETETVNENKKPVEDPSQDQRTEKDKVTFNLKRQAERAKEVGVDPAEVLGFKPRVEVPAETEDDDNKPLTRKDLREMQKQDARKSAEQMAQTLTDETERAAVLEELRFVVPSGDAQADFRRAQSIANAAKNAKIAEEAQRKTGAARTAAGGSSPSNTSTEEFEPTEDEAKLMKNFGISKEKVIEARKREAERLSKSIAT